MRWKQLISQRDMHYPSNQLVPLGRGVSIGSMMQPSTTAACDIHKLPGYVDIHNAVPRANFAESSASNMATVYVGNTAIKF